MELGISTCFNYDLPLEEMFSLLKRAGIGVISLGAKRSHSGYHTARGRAKIKALREKYGLRINSIHAPLQEGLDISSPQEKGRREGVESFQNAIEACADLGTKILILHLNSEFDKKELRERREAIYRSIETLSLYSEKRRVLLAVENLPHKDSMRLFEVTVHHFDQIGICFDSSHANLTPSPFGILERYGDRIIAIHISDNRGKEDDHLLPYEGVIDWGKFRGYFEKTGYEGIFLLEAEMRKSAFKDPLTFLREAERRGNQLMDGLS